VTDEVKDRYGDLCECTVRWWTTHW